MGERVHRLRAFSLKRAGGNLLVALLGGMSAVLAPGA